MNVKNFLRDINALNPRQPYNQYEITEYIYKGGTARIKKKTARILKGWRQTPNANFKSTSKSKKEGYCKNIQINEKGEIAIANQNISF